MNEVEFLLKIFNYYKKMIILFDNFTFSYKITMTSAFGVLLFLVDLFEEALELLTQE